MDVIRDQDMAGFIRPDGEVGEQFIEDLITILDETTLHDDDENKTGMEDL